MIIDDDFNENNLKKNSPFKAYYEKLLNKHGQNIKSKINRESCVEANFFYSPKMFEILSDYIHIVPFWTGIMLSFWKTLNPKFASNIKSRIDNNCVENWFGQLNSIFPDMPVMLSVYSTRMLLRQDSQFIDKYKFEAASIKLNKSKHSSEAKEEWCSRKTNVTKTRRTTFYCAPHYKLFNPLSPKIKNSETSGIFNLYNLL